MIVMRCFQSVHIRDQVKVSVAVFLHPKVDPKWLFFRTLVPSAIILRLAHLFVHQHLAIRTSRLFISGLTFIRHKVPYWQRPLSVFGARRLSNRQRFNESDLLTQQWLLNRDGLWQPSREAQDGSVDHMTALDDCPQN